MKPDPIFASLVALVGAASCRHDPFCAAPQATAAPPPRPALFAQGELAVHRLVEEEGPVGRPSQLSPDFSDQALTPLRGWLEPHFMTGDGALLLSEGGHVMVLGDLVVVVDTGIGRGAEHATRDDSAPFLRALEAAGLEPEDVDVVVNTHLHSDHMGWNTYGAGRPTFPGARYKIPRADWAWAQAHRGQPLFSTVDVKVRPLVEAGLVDFVDGTVTLAPGVRLEPWPGHTPGHQVLVIERGPNRVVFSGDLLHHPAQAALPTWDLFASDRDASIESRRRFLARYADGATRIVPTHLSGPGWGTLVAGEGGYRFVAGPRMERIETD